jgi:hypothetical protein
VAKIRWWRGNASFWSREPELDPFECLTVRSVSFQEAVELFNDGAFKHSLMSASMALGLRKLSERGLIRKIFS